MTHRTLWKMAILILITFGWYLLYWLVVTKNELNARGAQIPTGWLIIIPFANIYFLYKFAQGFAHIVIKNDQMTVAYFVLLLLLLPIGALVCQSNINESNHIKV